MPLLSCRPPWLLVGTVAMAIGGNAGAQDISFTPRTMLEWPTRSFSGDTEYRLTQVDGLSVLEARANGQASAKYLERDIDLNATPYLRWCWQVSNIHHGLDETTKPGDDYPARVYVARKTGLLPWQVESVNYVWSSSQAVGASWPNAFTERAVLMAVESGDTKVGQWVGEVRNVREDYRRLFGASPDSIDGIALMSDGDNAGVDATARFSRIELSASSAAPSCP